MKDRNCRLRQATEADLPALTCLDYEQTLFHMRLAPQMIQPASWDLYRERWMAYARPLLSDPKRLLLLADVDGTLVGYLHAKVESLPPIFVGAPKLFVEDLFVQEQYRGRRIGKSLLEEAGRWGKERGTAVLELNVLAANAEARAFYQKLGFEIGQLTLRKAL